MKASKKLKEGWFRNWMDSQTGGEYSRLKGEDPNEMKNPKIIDQVSKVGFEDYIKRLRTEGIEIGNSSSVAANIDRIKESVKEYIQAYMTSREEEQNRNEILIKIEPILDAFETLPTVNFSSIKKLFQDCALARVDALISVKAKLKPSSKPPAISNITSLLANIPKNKQLFFQTRLSNRSGHSVYVYLRNEGAYFLNLPKSIEDAIISGSMNTPPTVKITSGSSDYDVYPVKSQNNLQIIYNEFINWYSSRGYPTPMDLSSLVIPVNYDL